MPTRKVSGGQVPREAKAPTALAPTGVPCQDARPVQKTLSTARTSVVAPLVTAAVICRGWFTPAPVRDVVMVGGA